MLNPRRIGTLIPCLNTVIEMEFNRILPPRYQLHAGRLVDLLAVARRHDVDVTGWVAHDILATLPEECA